MAPEQGILPREPAQRAEHTENAPHPRANLPPEARQDPGNMEAKKRGGYKQQEVLLGTSKRGTGECKPGSGRGQGVTTKKETDDDGPLGSPSD